LLNNEADTEKYFRLDHKNPGHKDFVVINWCLGNVCNYSCTYCPEQLHRGDHKFPPLQTVLNFVDKTLQHYSGRKLYFEFTGGEVTLWKDLLPLARELKKRQCKIGIISNGSRSIDFYARLIEDIDHICLSFHPESSDEEHFLSVVKLCSEKIRTHANFMMLPEAFEQALAVSMRVIEIPNISIALQPLVEELSGPIWSYTPSQLKVMNMQGQALVRHIKHTRSFEYFRGAMQVTYTSGRQKTLTPQWFISAGQNNWQGWDCYAGLEQIVVDLDGYIYRGWCKAGGSLGKIDDSNLELPSNPIRCPKNNCHCNLDIMTSKIKPEPNLDSPHPPS